jgi:transcriptional regulator with XRE-family HTH domain
MIIDTVLSKIPPYISPINYLASALNLSKESIYRRIRDEVPFTLQDIYILATDLSISLDEIIHSSKEKNLNSKLSLFEYRSNSIFDPEQLFFEIFSMYDNSLANLVYKETEVIIAVNHLMIFSTIHLDHLFRFYYYKWVQQFHLMPLKFRLSDIEIPEKISILRDNIKSNGVFVGNNIYILDQNFIKNTLLEVQYYYKRKLISDEELLLIQQDFSSFVDMLEGMVKEKIKSPNFNSQIYIPSFRIESSGLYARYGDQEECHFWIYSGTHIASKDREVCKTYKAWLVSFKKYSSLITGCNEPLQTAFLDQQRSYVDNIKNKNFSYE